MSSIILFDGVCNLCNASVQFIINRDPKGIFQFASLQSEFGKKQLKQFGFPDQEYESIVLISENKVYQRSDAALRIARKLNGAWPLIYVFIIIPRFIRDSVYNWIAKNRYRWFGKKNECMIPSPELKARFIG